MRPDRRETSLRSLPLLHGVILVTSATIGAGIFSLPIVAAGMWFEWTVYALLAIWLLIYVGALLLLEATLVYSQGARWNLANSIGMAFLSWSGAIKSNSITINRIVRPHREPCLPDLFAMDFLYLGKNKLTCAIAGLVNPGGQLISDGHYLDLRISAFNELSRAVA